MVEFTKQQTENNWGSDKMTVGYCVGEISLSELTFISDKMPQVGEYVTVEYDGKKVLGMVESLVRGNDALNVDINDFKAIQKISRIGVEDNYIRGKVKILGDVNDDLKLPRTPVVPGTEIKLADASILKEIEDSKQEALDLLMDSRVFDFGYVYNTGSICFTIQDLVSANSNKSESMYASKMKAALKEYEKIVEAYLELE